MKSEINPELNVGDRIMLYHMEGELGVSPGTEGTVTNIGDDPFEENSKIIYVNWDNGSRLSLISSTDFWKKKHDKIQEDRQYNYFRDNPEIFEYFDWRFFADFLEKIRMSGIINMHGASPLLYAGEDHIERYYGENPPNKEEFEQVLSLANQSKDKMIQGTIKWMESQNKEITVENVNRYISKLANKMVLMFAQFIH